MVVLAVMFTAVWLRSREPAPGCWRSVLRSPPAGISSATRAEPGADIDTLARARLGRGGRRPSCCARSAWRSTSAGRRAGCAASCCCVLPARAGQHRLVRPSAARCRTGCSTSPACCPTSAWRCWPSSARARSRATRTACSAIALLTLPLLPFALAAAGVDTGDLRYYTGVAVIAFGMLVLTVSLLRAATAPWRARSSAAPRPRRSCAMPTSASRRASSSAPRTCTS